MRTLSVFDNVSLDGYFVDADGDMNWAHRRDPEWTEFTAGNARGELERLARRAYPAPWRRFGGLLG